MMSAAQSPTSSPYRVIFMGTPAYAAKILESLARDQRFELCLAISQPDRPQGRKQLCVPTAVHALAEQLNIPLLQPSKIKDPQLLAQLEAYQPDLMITAAYGRLVPSSILTLPRLGAINVHGSLLPAFRGASPVQSCIVSGATESGISWLLMDEELDHGPVIARRTLSLSATEDAENLMARLADLAAEQTPDILADYCEGRIKPVAQEHAQASWTHLLRREDGWIDWNRSALALDQQIRGLYPWPSTLAHYEGRDVKILQARPLTDQEDQEIRQLAQKASCVIEPGMLLSQGGEELIIACAEGSLAVSRLQFSGQKQQEASQIAHNLKRGSKFTSLGAPPPILSRTDPKK